MIARLTRLLVNALAAVGLGLVLVVVAVAFARHDIAAWYRDLPVVLATECAPGRR